MKFRCIDNDDGMKPLTIGRVYDCALDEKYLRTINDQGFTGSYLPKRFELVTDPNTWCRETVTLRQIADAFGPLVRSFKPYTPIHEILVGLAGDISRDHDFQMACRFEKRPTFVDPGKA